MIKLATILVLLGLASAGHLGIGHIRPYGYYGSSLIKGLMPGGYLLNAASNYGYGGYHGGVAPAIGYGVPALYGGLGPAILNGHGLVGHGLVGHGLVAPAVVKKIAPVGLVGIGHHGLVGNAGLVGVGHHGLIGNAGLVGVGHAGDGVVGVKSINVAPTIVKSVAVSPAVVKSITTTTTTNHVQQPAALVSTGHHVVGHPVGLAHHGGLVAQQGVIGVGHGGYGGYGYGGYGPSVVKTVTHAGVGHLGYGGIVSGPSVVKTVHPGYIQVAPTVVKTHVAPAVVQQAVVAPVKSAYTSGAFYAEPTVIKTHEVAGLVPVAQAHHGHSGHYVYY